MGTSKTPSRHLPRELIPTHITISRTSRERFFDAVADHLLDSDVSDLVGAIAPYPHARIRLSRNIEKAEHVEALIRFIQERGIPRDQIQIEYPQPAQLQLRQSFAEGLRASGLNFGFDVAEKDSALSRYFIRTPSFMAIARGARHIVVGPKGSGKSAILRLLTADAARALVITPEHYATDMLEAVRVKEISGELAAFVATWKYTLLIEIMRQVVHARGGDSRAQHQLRAYLADHDHMRADLTLLERFLAYLRRIRTVKGKLGPLEMSIESSVGDELAHLFKVGEILTLLPSLRSALRKVPFTVYIDELDQSWDNSETANRFLVALLTAAIQLRAIDDNLHVIVFLRTEIFDLLKSHLPQLDKLRSDIEVLEWNDRELSNLIASRALYALGLDDDMPGDLVIKSIFDGVVPYVEAPVFQYLLTRTGKRPREVIQFCNLALDVALKAGMETVTADAVLEAEEIFSAWRLEHIVAEHMYIYPRLELLMESFRGQTRAIAAATLDAHLTDYLLSAERDPSAPEWLLAINNPADLARTLYSIEVIGIEADRGTNQHNARRPWESYDFVSSRPKGKIERSTTFLFHPGLWKSLELREV